MRSYRITLKYPDGTPMFMGTVHAEEIVETPRPERPSPNGAQSDSGERMTGPSEALPVPALGAQGVEGKKPRNT